ncbi:MAG: hypothetical protein Q4G09_05745 [Clostridia bacterium]|nr:hypothetical protein [Clostridia bacterium]
MLKLKQVRKVDNIFTIKNISIYLLAINLLTFLIMYMDKRKAKKIIGE